MSKATWAEVQRAMVPIGRDYSYPDPPEPEIVQAPFYRDPPIRGPWMDFVGLPMPGRDDLEPPVIDWCDGPYRGTRS